jgi:hypothetical protein
MKLIFYHPEKIPIEKNLSKYVLGSDQLIYYVSSDILKIMNLIYTTKRYKL